MLFEILIFLNMACMPPKIINVSNEPWITKDQGDFSVARTRCLAKYPERSPCLKQFIKTDHATFKAWCGPGVIKWRTYSYMFMKRRKYGEGYKTSNKRYVE